MGSAPSRSNPQPEPRRRAPRKKKNEPEKNDEPNDNIKGSPTIQLKRIQDLVCDSAKNYDKMDKEEIVNVLKTIRRLSTPKTGE